MRNLALIMGLGIFASTFSQTQVLGSIHSDSSSLVAVPFLPKLLVDRREHETEPYAPT